MLEFTAEQLREAWIRAAEAEWEKTVKLPESAPVISQYFRDVGWMFMLNTHADGEYSEAARKANPGTLDYCGIFVGAMGLRVGEHLEENICYPVRLKPVIARVIMPSTYRLQSRDRWSGIDPDPFEEVSPEEIQRGDIVTLQTSRTPKPYGDHIVIVSDADLEARITCIEANTVGLLPDGSRGRGVARRTRALSLVRKAWRPGVEHFDIGA